LDDWEISRLASVFDKVDQNGDGVLTQQEFLDYVKQITPSKFIQSIGWMETQMSEERIIDKLESEFTKSLSLDEFLNALCQFHPQNPASKTQ